MKKSRVGVFNEGLTAVVFCLWCLFWMLQPAVYCPGITEWRWFGFPAQYAFWLVGMVIMVPLTCFAYAAWANRRDGQPPKEDEG